MLNPNKVAKTILKTITKRNLKIIQILLLAVE